MASLMTGSITEKSSKVIDIREGCDGNSHVSVEKQEAPLPPSALAEAAASGATANTDDSFHDEANRNLGRQRTIVQDSFVSNHALLSKERFASEVERVTASIERRREERVVVTYDVQVALIEDCRAIARAKQYSRVSRIHIDDLLDYRQRISHKYEKDQKTPYFNIVRLLGFRNRNEQLLRVLDRAVDLVEHTQTEDDNDFHYMDFNCYYTRVESRWPWMRHGVSIGLMYVVAFYIFTPIFFCAIVEDHGVCPKQVDQHYAGWVGALYFASTTLSTVGYGDLTVEKDKVLHVFAGCVYMILANATLIGSFSVAVGGAWNPLSEWHEKLVNRVRGEPTHEEPLHVKIHRVRILRLTELIGGFIVLNLIGVFANRLFLLAENEEDFETDWTWMTSFYWAIQTTTTIGYGDLDQPPNQRIFQIFYLVLSTYFVGNALGGLAGLRDEMEQIRREAAWERREVSKNLVDELQPEDHDGKVDQYEFLVASLVQLGKLSSKDVVVIMDKYRSLAGEDGYITAKQAKQAAEEVTDGEIQEVLDETIEEHRLFKVKAPVLHRMGQQREMRRKS